MARKSPPTVGWAPVQHTGYGTGGKAGFIHGLEAAACNAREADKVRNAGGLVFQDYTEADDYCMAEMYPPDVVGMYPKAPGTFARINLDGRRVYRPVPAEGG